VPHRKRRKRKYKPRQLKWPNPGTQEEQVWDRLRAAMLPHEVYAALEATIPRANLKTYVSRYRRWSKGGVPRALRIMSDRLVAPLSVPLDAETQSIFQLEADEAGVSLVMLVVEALTFIADEDLFGKVHKLRQGRAGDLTQTMAELRLSTAGVLSKVKR
jgi:hypothetical protein